MTFLLLLLFFLFVSISKLKRIVLKTYKVSRFIFLKEIEKEGHIIHPRENDSELKSMIFAKKADRERPLLHETGLKCGTSS